MRRYFLILCGLLALGTDAVAQNSYDLSILRSWEHNETTGDLNKDGIDDLVVIATPANEANMKVREDGYVYNFNQPVLAIYWGDGNGGYRLWKGYDDVIPPRQDEAMSVYCGAKITNRHTLVFSVEYFATMGGWDTPNYTYVFRYQDGDFCLIGEEETHTSRLSGELETDSYNYLTNKNLRTTGNVFDEKAKSTQRWSKIPKSPLKRLGAWQLGE